MPFPPEFLGGLFCVLPFAVIGILGTVFWVWMLIECITKEPSEGNDKLIWALVIILLHLFGAALYFFVRRPTRIEDHGE